jgi:hypothetical protein
MRIEEFNASEIRVAENTLGGLALKHLAAACSTRQRKINCPSE